MEFRHKDCLHCTIIKEVGRRLENGEISGRGTLDNLVLVMADILATAPIEDAKKMKGAIMQNLSEAEAQARHRIDYEIDFARKGRGRRRDCPAGQRLAVGCRTDEICRRKMKAGGTRS
jgi:hypothetical protein